MDFIKRWFGARQEVDLEEVTQSLNAKISGLRKPAVRLLKSDSKTNSKFGGRPLVDGTSFVWPESNGKPMTFLGQIDLSEIARQFQYGWLDDKGSVLFFYDVFEMPWGFDPKDKGKWRVIYYENADTLAAFPDSMDDTEKIKETFMAAKRIDILPNYEDETVVRLNLSDAEADLYCELDATEGPVHQVGGFPCPIQGNHMELESQLASNGVYVGTPEGYASPEAKSLEAGAKDWKLLLQLDSDDDLDLMWGDCGRLYFWVQKDKSKLNQFDDCWLVLQCY